MKTKTLKLKIIGAIFILLSPFFIFGANARGGDDDGRGRGGRLAENDDDSRRNRGNDDDDSRRNRGNDDDSSNRRGRGPGGQRFLRDEDANRVTRIIGNVNLRIRASFIQRVINRINALEITINSSSLRAEEKIRRLAILAEIKDILNEELSNIGDPADTTPIVISGFSLNSVGDTSVTVSVNVNEAGRGYFVVLPSGSAVPSATQVKDGRNSSGVTANIKGSRNLVSGANSFSISGLSPNVSYTIYFTAQDNSGNLQTSVNSLSFTTSNSDVTAPILSFSVSTVGSLGATFSVNSNEAGKLYFVVLPSGSAVPSATQVKDGRNSSGVTANIKGDRNIISGTISFSVSGLTTNTSYVIFLIAQDNSGNLQTNVSSLAFTTSTIDVTAPTISLSLSGTTSSGATFTVNSNEVGKGYFVVLPNGSGTPSAAQIKAGLDSSGISTTIKGNLNLTVGINLVDLSGLNSLTSYVVYFTAEDSTGNLQQIPLSFGLTTK